MSATTVTTSPLQAARAWRGIALIVAARNSGLTVAQAESLETGSMDGFGSVDEMVAAAVVYSASLGIGRDEAVALLDRTISGEDHPAPEAGLPNAAPPMAGLQGFSRAVRGRSAALAGAATGVSASLEPGDFDNRPAPRIDAAAANMAASMSPAQVMIPVPEAPLPQTPVQPDAAPVVAAPLAQLPGPFDAATTGELPMIRAGAPTEVEVDVDGYRHTWEENPGELEQWASTHAAPAPADNPLRRAGATVDGWVVKGLGQDRADRLFEQRANAVAATREAIGSSRERLRESEHATLFVAVAGGVVLIALLVAIASVMGGEEPAPKPKAKPAAEVTPAVVPPSAAAPDAAAKPAAKATPGKPAVKPMLAPSDIQLQVLNAGSTSGKAKVLAAQLQGRGYTVAKVGNSQSRYGTSVILYPKQYQREAERLAKQTGVTTLDTYPGSAPAMTIITV